MVAISGHIENDNNLDRLYVYGNYIDEVLYCRNIMTKGPNPPSTIWYMEHYYAHNHLFSVCALLADDGSVAERYEYNAYGKLTIWNSTFTTTSTASAYDNPYYFTGRRLDTFDSGGLDIMYYRNRYYSPETGRFLTHDPAGFVDGINLYQYIMSMPIVYSDPIGMYSQSPNGITRIGFPTTDPRSEIPSCHEIMSCNEGPPTPLPRKLNADDITVESKAEWEVIKSGAPCGGRDLTMTFESMKSIGINLEIVAKLGFETGLGIPLVAKGKITGELSTSLGVSYGANTTTTMTFSDHLTGSGEKGLTACYCTYIKKVSVFVSILKTIVGEGYTYDMGASSSKFVGNVTSGEVCPPCYRINNPHREPRVGDLVEVIDDIWM